jgi:hypothetical protein
VLSVAGGVVLGAAAVAAIWLWTGEGGTASVLRQDPGIPPPDYVYLDNARVVLYLGQMEGGLSASEKLTEQLTQNRNATLAASGFQLGGSSDESSARERIVTPTATARFYRLLDRLQANEYLHTVDAALKPKALAGAFATIPEGTFVRLHNCMLRIPPYVQFGQLWRASHGAMSDIETAFALGGESPETMLAVEAARIQSPGGPKSATGTGAIAFPAGTRRRLAAAGTSLARLVRRNPRVPMSCGETANPQPAGLDMLFPVRLGELSPERSLLAGPVTVVGKVVRVVRRPDDAYVDSASLALFQKPVETAAMFGGAIGEGGLEADVTVLPPGAVILPIAIYK